MTGACCRIHREFGDPQLLLERRRRREQRGADAERGCHQDIENSLCSKSLCRMASTGISASKARADERLPEVTLA